MEKVTMVSRGKRLLLLYLLQHLQQISILNTWSYQEVHQHCQAGLVDSSAKQCLQKIFSQPQLDSALAKLRALNVNDCPWVCRLGKSRATASLIKSLFARLIMQWLTFRFAAACPKGKQLYTKVTFLLSWHHLTKDGKCQWNRMVCVTLRGNFMSQSFVGWSSGLQTEV